MTVPWCSLCRQLQEEHLITSLGICQLVSLHRTVVLGILCVTAFPTCTAHCHLSEGKVQLGATGSYASLFDSKGSPVAFHCRATQFPLRKCSCEVHPCNIACSSWTFAAPVGSKDALLLEQELLWTQALCLSPSAIIRSSILQGQHHIGAWHSVRVSSVG